MVQFSTRRRCVVMHGGKIMQRNRLRIRQLLMTTASATAMIVGLNSGAAAAGCTAVVVPASNSTVIDCIEISGTGNFTNTLPGTISNTTTGGAASSTHAVAVTGTLTGQIQNNGTIISRYTHLPTRGGARARAIPPPGMAREPGGLTTRGPFSGCARKGPAGRTRVQTVLTCLGGILSPGTITAAGKPTAPRPLVAGVETFAGGIS